MDRAEALAVVDWALSKFPELPVCGVGLLSMRRGCRLQPWILAGELGGPGIVNAHVRRT